MRVQSILSLWILVIVFSVNPPPLLSAAQAARISAPGLHVKAAQADKADGLWPSDPVLCDLVLDGNIEEGDATSLERKFQTLPEMNAFTYFLCLRSSGGDLREALKIAEFVRNTQR